MGETYRMRRRLGALALTLLALPSLALPAVAGPEDRLHELEEKQDKVNERLDEAVDQQDRLRTDLNGLDQARDAIEDRVADLDSDLSALDADIARVKDRLMAAQQELTSLTEQLDRIDARLSRREDLLARRAVAAYKAGPTATADSLLSAESIADLVDRFEYYRSSLDAEAALIGEIQSLRSETEATRAEVEEKKTEIADEQLALEERRADVAALREQRAAALAEKEDIIGAKETLLADAEDRESRLEEWLNQLEADSARIESIIASASADAPAPPSGPLPSGGGDLLWPAAGPLTSPYGYRVHPIFGYSRLHSGIDIGAPYGAPVVAADAGTVSFVGTMSGYGNVVVVDHGGGMSTTYNHLSAFSVGSGQSVSRGQTVAAVGSTGYSTGPHLHFEVRINGSPVDPMPYLQ